MRSAGNEFLHFPLVHSRALFPARPCRWVEKRERRELFHFSSCFSFSLLVSAALSPRREIQFPAAPNPARDQRDQFGLEFQQLCQEVSVSYFFQSFPACCVMLDDAWKWVYTFSAYCDMFVRFHDDDMRPWMMISTQNTCLSHLCVCQCEKSQIFMVKCMMTDER